MRVGLVTYDFYPPIGGQGAEAYALYRAFERDPDVDALAFSASSNDLAGHVRLPGAGGPAANLRFSLVVDARMRRLEREHGLDLVQAYGGPGGVMLARGPRAPLVYVANHTYALQRQHFPGRPYYVPLQAAERRGYSLSRAIVAISTTTRDDLVRSYGVPPEKIAVIPPGTDLHRFPARDAEPEDAPILFVGRLDKRKGVDLLLRAHARLPEGERPPLWIAGSGPLREPLERLVASLGTGDRVRFLGRVPDDDLPALYRSASVFVLPSRFEGFGVVLVEAMASGVPVVGTRVAGIVDVIDDASGVLVPPEDADALASALRRLLADAELRRALGKTGRARAERVFSHERVASLLKSVYARILEGAPLNAVGRPPAAPP